MNSPIARSYPKRAQRTAATYTTATNRRQRRSAAAPATSRQLDQSEPPQKWTRVLRFPSSAEGEPYFGSSPIASFKVPVWVRVSDLTEEERVKYEEGEKRKEEERAAWKKVLEERRASEMEVGDDDEEETKNEDEFDNIESNGDQNNVTAEEATSSPVEETPVKEPDQTPADSESMETGEVPSTESSNQSTETPQVEIQSALTESTPALAESTENAQQTLDTEHMQIESNENEAQNRDEVRNQIHSELDVENVNTLSSEQLNSNAQNELEQQVETPHEAESTSAQNSLVANDNDLEQQDEACADSGNDMGRQNETGADPPIDDE